MWKHSPQKSLGAAWSPDADSDEGPACVAEQYFLWKKIEHMKAELGIKMRMPTRIQHTAASIAKDNGPQMLIN